MFSSQSTHKLAHTYAQLHANVTLLFFNYLLFPTLFHTPAAKAAPTNGAMINIHS